MEKKDLRKFTWFIAIIFTLRILSSDFSDIKSVFFGMFEGFGAILNFSILILLIIQILDNRREINISEESYKESKTASFRVDLVKSNNHEKYVEVYVEVYNIGLSSAYDIQIECFSIGSDSIKTSISLGKVDQTVSQKYITKSLLKSEDMLCIKFLTPKIVVKDYCLKIVFSDRDKKLKEEVIELIKYKRKSDTETKE